MIKNLIAIKIGESQGIEEVILDLGKMWRVEENKSPEEGGWQSGEFRMIERRPSPVPM